MEVVDVGLVVHLDGVGTGRERRHIRAVRAGEAGSRSPGRRSRSTCCRPWSSSRSSRCRRCRRPRRRLPAPDHHSQRQECETDDQTDACQLHANPPSSLVLDDTRRVRDRFALEFRRGRARDRPGLWRWTAYHEEWHEDVGCTFVNTEDGVALIDPLVPTDDEARFWKALDRDVKRASGASTSSSPSSGTRGAPPRCASATTRGSGRRRAARRQSRGVPASSPTPSRSATSFREGSRRAAPPALRRSSTGCPSTPHFVPGDVLLGDGKGGAKMCPESWLPDSKTHRDLAASLRPLLDLPVRRILVSHGKPVVTGGGRALARALEI